MKLILVFFSIFALKTCDNTQKIKSGQNNTLGGVYHIYSIPDTTITDPQLTIEFDAETKQVSGFSGCNRFFGTFSLNENSLKMGPLASTKMFCDDSANKIETALLESLSKMDSFKNENGTTSFLSNKKVLIRAIKAEKQNVNVSFEYSAHSRGKFSHIIIDKKSMSVKNKRDTTPIIKKCPKSSWNRLLKAFEPVNVENIPNLKAPSEKRFFDGAAIAKLKITYNGKTYETPSFDHGNPPQEIAELVKEILSISENIE
ncbi:META domain-containing protein [Mariniflexile sp.]|uniref:META domain-containing protein n=1 Tax=Mariniflexile sp. TaxID=1979402 RepID=UPI004047201B